jgi:hypothetical protein
VAPPSWAVQMTALLKQQSVACEAFFKNYSGLLTQGVPGVPQDPLTPPSGPMGILS